MPRLRRAALHRRQRPQLNEQIWLWLQGKKSYDELPEANKWDYFVVTRGHFRNESEYWVRVHQAVLNGEIEVSPDKVHYMDDAPLVVSVPQ